MTGLPLLQAVYKLLSIVTSSISTLQRVGLFVGCQDTGS